MDSDDGVSIGTASTDTSMFLRELQALNTEGSAALSAQIPTRQSAISDTIEVTASGGAGDSQTLTQAMKTMIGGQPAQIINLAENVDESSVSIYSPEVQVYVTPTSGSFVEKSSGSNKVKITPVVNHVWELKYYYGNLVAVHRDGDYVAYVIRGKSGGNVRVLSRKTAHRVLLKAFSGSVMDIAFALSDDVYLAAADEGGNLFVYSFSMEGDNIASNLILHIEKEVYNIESDFRNLTRVIWCPYMPDEDNDNDVDPAKMLAFLHGTQAEVWNIDMVYREFGSGPLSSKTVSSGVMCVEPYEPLMPVVNAAFAPDGSAIAIGYHSGVVKFFLVDLDGGDSDTAECMYEWNPHDGHPVSSLYFLDDHKHPGSDLQLWKFALTGAKHNTEIKIWSCETWKLIQTLHFEPPLTQTDLQLQLKSEIDLASKYLALSDINSRVLYVLQLYQNYATSTAHFSSLSQFSLTQPCLSFAIFDAGIKKFRHSANDSHLDEITTGELDENHDDDDEQEGRNDADSGSKVTTGVQIKIFGVHTKSLQELLIRYRPETSAPPPHTPSVSSMSQEDAGLRDMLSDLSMDQSEVSQDQSNIAFDASQPALVTPAIFSTSSPSGAKGNVTTADQTPLSTSSTSSFTQVTAMNEDLLGMDSPRSSVDPSTVLSPSSTFTQTPQHAKPSPSSNVSLSDVPLPPVTSAEEDELATPKHSVSGSSGGSANQTLNNSVRSNQEILEEMFSGTQSMGKLPSGLGNSLESTSSTGSFPIGRLVEPYNNQDERYDENDKEVAEALGLEKEEDIEEVEEQLPSSQQEERKEVVWPEPPDVSTEAKRLVDEAIEQSTQEEEDEKETDFYDDENDEAEVEEIIQRSGADDDDDDDDEEEDNVDDVVPRDYPKSRPHRNEEQISPGESINMWSYVTLSRPEPGQAPVQVLTSIDSSISRLAEQLEQQQVLMQQMQSELNRQREIQMQLHRHQIEQDQLHQMTAQQGSLEKDISKLEDILISRMEHSLAQHMQRETQRLQDSLKASDAQRKQRDESLHTSVLNEVIRATKDTVSNSLRTEIKQTVNPALHRFVEPMKEKIHQEVAHRLTACDSLLKDNIAKAVKSRSTMDVLAASVGDVIYQQMQQAYTDTFKTVLLPSFKAAMEKTTRDVHGIFQQGTKEYQLYMRQSIDQMLRERYAAEEVVTRMEAAERQFIQSTGEMKNTLIGYVRDELGGQVAGAVGGIKEEILSDVRKIMKEEMSTAMREHGANISDKLNTYLRSGAATPVSLTSEEEINKERIMRELRSGRINEAFQCALSAGNLELVVYTCEAAKPMDIFNQSPCVLTQPVLLSLISQLSASLEKNFDLKIKYLEEAVMNLDQDQPTTADHIPTVLGSLVQRLRITEAHGGDARKIKSIKMLIMAANSLLT